MNMVERMALAMVTDDLTRIWEESEAGPRPTNEEARAYWMQSGQRIRGKYLRHARAAIEAMREPSEKMIETGAEHAYDAQGWTSACVEATAVFISMIDAALKDT